MKRNSHSLFNYSVTSVSVSLASCVVLWHFTNLISTFNFNLTCIVEHDSGQTYYASSVFVLISFSILVRCLSAIVQSRHFSLFSHTAQMPDETDAKNIIAASPLENWRRPPGCPRTVWMKTIQQDLKSNNHSLNEATDVA